MNHDPQSPSPSTEPAVITPLSDLGYLHLGRTITVLGRNTTLGVHKAPPLLHTGTVEAIHINETRTVLVMLPPRDANGRQHPRRVIEVA